ncbi:MAG: prolyl oligopeptidase family serine peptidase [Stenotrophobium sp.]
MPRICPMPAGLVVAMLLSACGSSSAPNVGAAGNASHAWLGQGSGVFRDAQYDQGEWIYSNGIWQARGANADGLHRTDYYAALMPLPADPTYITRDVYNALTYDFFGAHRAAHNGDYALPLDHKTWPDGTGDLAEVRLAADRQNLYVRFLWNSMPRPDAQIATLTFAASGSAPAAAPWPRNARLSSAWTAALTVWGTGAVVQNIDGHEIAVPASVGDHITQAQIPLSQLPPAPWTLTGGSGLDDPQQPGLYWDVSPGLATQNATGSGALTVPTNVWDLLFAPDTPWTFDERRQADDLARGDVSADQAQVDLSKLQSGQTELSPTRTGDFSLMFASHLFEADGITRNSQGALPVALPVGVTALPVGAPDINVSYLYTGRLQTYSMHVPASYSASAAAYPLIVYLHGFTGLPEEPFYNPVGLVQMADQQGYLLASALGRGDYFYRGEGDLDVLEVIADVSRRYHVDPDRIYLMGHSMGGYGTNNVGTHHPDLFAAIAPAEGTDSADLYANLRDLPWFEMTADEDLDTLAQAANALYSSLSAAGYDATLLEYRAKTHEYSSIYDTLPRLFRFFAAHRRKVNPAVVSYTRVPDEDRADLGLIYDGAYWLSGLRAADATHTANVTLESDGIAHVVPDPATAVRTDQMVDEGGPSGRTLADLKQTVPNSAPASVISNTLILSAANAGAMTIDLKRASLSVDNASLTIDSTADTPLLLKLSGAISASVAVNIDNLPAATLAVNAGSVTVSVPAGTHRLILAGR